MSNIKFVFFSFLSLFFFACKGSTSKKIQWTKEQSSNLNRDLSQTEAYEIKQFVERHSNWKLTKTGTGLQYMIFQKGNGAQAIPGLYAKVNYKIGLLDGTICYSSDSLGASSFLIDHSDVESGLQEGIKFLHVGDKAVFIIPSHLAHGLLGDRNKIPPLQTVIFSIELLQLSTKP